MCEKQKTLAESLELCGIGTHSGLVSCINILPAEKNTGILFKRTDVEDSSKSIIKASPENVIDPIMCTRMVNDYGVEVALIEHLMAAFKICGITNAIVETSNIEIPIMDGSSAIFIENFEQAGILEQAAFVDKLVIDDEIVIEHNNSKIKITPSNEQTVRVSLDYSRINPVIGSRNKLDLNSSRDADVIKNKVGYSRTFGWLADAEKLQAAGMARGASEENTIIISNEHKVMNKEGLRFENEIINHKMLDIIGDLSILGVEIIGSIEAVNPCHFLNNKLTKHLQQSFL